MAEPEDLESFWKVIRRTNGEATSPQTMSPIEAIERIVRGLEATSKVYGDPMKRPPSVQLRPFTNKDGAVVAGHWIVTVEAADLVTIPPPVAKDSIEEALETTFQQVISVLEAKRDGHRKSADGFMDKFKKEMGLVADLERVMAAMGGYEPHQANLPLPLPDAPPPPPPPDSAFSKLLDDLT
jgi:hypothetical protein